MGRYSDETKTKVLKFLDTNTLEATSRQFGMTTKTITSWRKDRASAKVNGKTTTPSVATTNPTTVEVSIPEHVIRAAAAKYLEQRLGFKIIQF